MNQKNPKNDSDPDQDLWCLDLSKKFDLEIPSSFNKDTLTWTVCQSSGDKPGTLFSFFSLTHSLFRHSKWKK